MNSYLKNASVLFVERLCLMALSLVSNIVMAKYLSQDQYGIIGYLLGLIGTCTPLGKWAYDAVLVRELVRHPADTVRIIWQGVRLRLWGCLLPILLVLAVHIYIGGIGRELQWLFWLCFILLGNALEVPVFYFQAKSQNYVSSGIKVSVATVATVTRLYLLYMGVSFDFVILSYLVEPLLSICGLWGIFYLRSKTVLTSQEVLESLKESKQVSSSFRPFQTFRLSQTFVSSWPLALMAFVSLLNARGDFLIIKQMVGNSQLAVYSVAARLSEVWYFLPTIFGTAFFPFLSQKQSTSPSLSDEQFGLVRKLSSLGALVAVGIALLAQLWAAPVVVFLFGQKYATSVSILQIHIWAGIFIFFGHPISKILIAQQLERYLLYTKLVGTTINITLNYWLIPQMGIVGAAWASLVSYGIGSCFGYLLFTPTRNIIWQTIGGRK